MDDKGFDALTRRAGRLGTRRGVLGALAGGLAVVTCGANAGAEKPKQPDAAACKQPGARCTGNDQCCSKRCLGKKGKKKCRNAPAPPPPPPPPPEPVASICTVEDDFCRIGVVTDCGAGATSCICVVTRQGRPFCGNGIAGVAECTSNDQCAAELGPGSACVRDGRDDCVANLATFCMRPCANPA